jgi:hypothetical protein
VVGLVYAPRRLFSFFYFILNNTFGGIIEEWFTFECQHSWDMMYYTTFDADYGLASAPVCRRVIIHTLGV